MKLSISNIAWPAEEDALFLKYIREWDCSGVEIAPSRLWPNPLDASLQERQSFKSLVQKNGLEICALQALLYSRPDLGLFRKSKVEAETVEYLKGLCHLAADLGASVLVFGSPANRKRGNIPFDDAFKRAASFFNKVSHTAKELGVFLCIEPLRQQETDFITTAHEGIRLVEMVNSEGFGLHLDAKAVSEENGNYLDIFKSVLHRLKHFHINDPDLMEVNSSGIVGHFSLGKALKQSGYNRYASIEMRTMPEHFSVIKRSLEVSKKAYID